MKKLLEKGQSKEESKGRLKTEQEEERRIKIACESATDSMETSSP